MTRCWTLVVLMVVAVFTGFSESTHITFAPCDGLSNIEYVDLSPCDALPCVFHKGSTVNVTISFSTAAAVDQVTAKVHGIIGGIPIPFQLPKANGCQGCNLQCPLSAGQHVYMNSFSVLAEYPTIRLPVKWELVDKSNNIVCFVFPMSIVD